MTSKTFTISGKTSELKHSLQNTLYLENGNYGLALISLDMFYSVPNITKKNNKFKYSLDSGVSWNTITLNKGFYTLDLLYNEIKFILNLKNAPFSFSPNKAKPNVRIEIKDPKFQINFKDNDTFGNLLGFNFILKDGIGFYDSSIPINFFPLNQIFIKTNITEHEYLNGRLKPIVYNFFPNCLPGDRVIEKPFNLIYHKIIKKTLHELHIEIVDENDNHIDLNNETIYLTFHLKDL